MCQEFHLSSLRTRSLVIAVLLLAGAAIGCKSDDLPGDVEALRVVIDDALTLPSFNDSGDRAAFLSLRNDLVTAVVIDVDTGEEVWTGPSSYFRGDLDPLHPPLVVDGALYVNTFEQATLDASISRVDMSSGTIEWTSSLGPHNGSPFRCADRSVCVDGLIDGTGPAIFSYDLTTGDLVEGSVGGTLLYADSEVIIAESNGQVVASADAGASSAWSADIMAEFGHGGSSLGGSWSTRLDDDVIVWLGDEAELTGRAVSFDAQTGASKKLTEGEPCLLPADSIDSVCFLTGDRMVLLDASGRVVASASHEMSNDDLVPPHVVGPHGEVVVTSGPTRLATDGLPEAALPTEGWCAITPPDLLERAQGPDVLVRLGKRFYPCDLSSMRALSDGEDEDLVAQSIGSLSETRLLAHSGDRIAYFATPDDLVITDV